MIEIIVAILFAVVMAAVIYFLLKKAVFLLINAIVGLVALFVINLLGVMSWGARRYYDLWDLAVGARLRREFFAHSAYAAQWR